MMKKLCLTLLVARIVASQGSFPPVSGGGGGGGGAYTQPSATYSGTSFLPAFGALPGNATEANVQIAAPVTGTYSNMSVKLGTTPGVGNGLTFTMRDAAANTALTCATGNTTSCTDFTHSVTVTQGDLIDFSVVATGTPAATTVAIVFATPGPAGPSGGVGPTGPTGNTVLNGSGVPSNGTGNNGDYYLRTDTSCLYGPKAAGAWPASCTSLVGPQGPNGSSLSAINPQSGVNYTYVNSDCTKEVTRTNASGMADILPQAGTGGNFAAGCGIWVNNRGSGQLIITPTVSTINGASSLKLLSGQSALIISDGTNYLANAGAGSASAGASGTLQCADGNGGYIACTAGLQYTPATSGAVPLAGNGAGGTAPATQSQLQTVLAPGTNCGITGNAMLIGGNCGAIGGQPAQDIPVTQAGAAATFTCSSNSVNTFRITLTASVTSSTLANCGAGQVLNFVINAGTNPFTFAYPSGFTLAASIAPIANAVTKQIFEWNGASAIPLGPATSDSGPSILIEQAMPASTPPTGMAFCVDDSTQHGFWQCKDSNGNLNTILRAETCVANAFVNGVLTTGRVNCVQPAAGNLTDYNSVVVTNAARTLAALLTAPGGDLFLGGVTAISATSYTIGQADENKLTTFNNAAAVAVTLPQTTTAGFGAGAFFFLVNRGAGTATVTPNVSTINGSATVTLAQNQGCLIVSDGTNYSAWISASPAGGNASTVNGGSLPGSAPFIGTNASNQIILATPFMTNAQTATYQVLASDFTNDKTILVSGGTFTITLVANTSQPPTGQLINIINYGSGVVTVARSGQNINGGTTSLTIPAGTATAPSGAQIVSDGINYFADVFTPPALANITGLGAGVGTFLATPSYTNLSSAVTGATLTQTIASGTSALGTAAIASGACATVVTTTATGAASTDSIIWDPNASIKAVTGYVPATTGGLTIAAYPTTNNVNFDVCNWSNASITPGGVTINWRVVR